MTKLATSLMQSFIALYFDTFMAVYDDFKGLYLRVSCLHTRVYLD